MSIAAGGVLRTTVRISHLQNKLHSRMGTWLKINVWGNGVGVGSLQWHIGEGGQLLGPSSLRGRKIQETFGVDGLVLSIQTTMVWGPAQPT